MYQKSAPETIRKMFSSIAENYDRANTTFTFGLHKKWNRKLIQSVGEAHTLLDLCAGTGEIGFGFLAKYPNARAILLDFCPEMLAIAQSKGTPFKGRFSLIEGDAQALPLESASVDAATISYGIRNVKEPLRCFREAARVLKPGGRFAILELTRPASPFLRLSHKAYLKFCLPILGKFAAKNIHAYRYLSKSVQEFVSPADLEELLKEAGLKPIKRISLMGGLSTILVSIVPTGGPIQHSVCKSEPSI
ncbi:MAG: bifunctional demethylmenaquinone methyltransferase/2-methoxy-6-polyprenyl-1,4-benzoquinol methylase UbiE [Chlamydiales bacterium]|nr:bifunctional demethylmenaquinone methyltransferase/2-methoxy-6-polyprenyl-1,4-benzoquinol methylase UbiE [Chlamydiales bacterium]